MIRVIAMDMDGTLLNSEKRISPRTREALLRAQKEGIVLILASGTASNPSSLSSAMVFSLSHPIHGMVWASDPMVIISPPRLRYSLRISRLGVRSSRHSPWLDGDLLYGTH